MYIGRRAPLIAATLVVLMFAGSVGGAYALTGTTSGDLPERYVATLAGAVRADVNIDFGAGTLIVGPLPEASADLIDANYFGRRGRTNIRRTGDTAIVDVTMDGRNFFSASITCVGNWRCPQRLRSPLIWTEAPLTWTSISAA